MTTLPKTIRLGLLSLLLVTVPLLAAEPEGAWLGVFLGDAVDGGVPVVALFPGGPAARGGVRSGDVVLRAADRPLLDRQELIRILEGRSAGERLNLDVLRNGDRLELVVLLGERREAAPPPFTVAVPRTLLTPGPQAAHRLNRGLQVVDMTPELRRHYGAPERAGVLVTGVEPEIFRPPGGLHVGDVVVRMADGPVESAEQFRRFLEGSVSDGDVPLRVELVRGGDASPVLLYPTAVESAPSAPGTSGAMEQAIVREIRRLEERIDALRSELERLKEQP